MRFEKTLIGNDGRLEQRIGFLRPFNLGGYVILLLSAFLCVSEIQFPYSRETSWCYNDDKHRQERL